MNKRKILLAVNDGETSFKAVRYVGDICGRMSDCEICLLNVSPEPPPYYYLEGHSLADYVKERNAEADILFKKVIEDILQPAGIAPARISTRSYVISQAETISAAIRAVQREGGFETVVVGKRGVSKAEEFLFGSISNAMAQSCESFTVWIVA
ncbi:MAG TPA: universal stress protein [Desulfobacterales bacterium]|nr:universal stress protein [Desulfobacterales bacterium]